MNWRKRLLRWNFYFTRGKKWPDLVTSLASMVVIFWGLRQETLPFLSDWFGSIFQFAVAFLFMYILGGISLGQVDTKHGTFPMETTVAALNTPWIQDLFKALSLIGDEEVKSICVKWIKVPKKEKTKK